MITRFKRISGIGTMRKRNSPAKRPAFESPGAVAEKEAADHDQHRGEHDDRQLVRVTRRERRSPRERVHQRASDNQGEPRTPVATSEKILFRSRMSRKALASGTSRMCE